MALSVLQVLPALNEGGVERGTLEIARYLVEKGHHSMVLSSGGRLVRQLRSEGSVHLRGHIGVKSPHVIHWIWRLRRMLFKHRVNILHARSRLPAWIAYWAWQGMPPTLRPRFITTVHGLYSVNRYSAIMTRGEAVIAVSNTIKDYIKTNYPQTPENRIHLIPRGIDSDQFPYGFQPTREWAQKWRREFPQLTGKYVITLPGRLSRQKGHEDFLRIIARASISEMPVHGLIVGEVNRRSDYVQALRSTVQRHGLPITFCGHRDDIREIYSQSDLVLSLAVKPESFGRTVLEPLSLGIPVIGYDHGGVGEILSVVFPSGLSPPGDVEDVVEKIAAFVKQPPHVPDKQLFPLRAMQAKTLALYESLATRS